MMALFISSTHRGISQETGDAITAVYTGLRYGRDLDDSQKINYVLDDRHNAPENIMTALQSQSCLAHF